MTASLRGGLPPILCTATLRGDTHYAGFANPFVFRNPYSIPQLFFGEDQSMQEGDYPNNRVIIFSVILIIVVVLGFALYMRAVYLRQGEYVLTRGVPPAFNEIRLIPTVVYQKPLSGFTVYNLSGGFNTTTDELERGVVGEFPSLNNNNDPNTSYVISNLTLEYSTVGVVIVKPPGDLGPVLSYANKTLFGVICENYISNPQETYCGHLGDTPYMVYYTTTTIGGVNYYSYTVLAWSSTTIVILQYQSTLDVSVLQLQRMSQLLLQQRV